MSLWTYQFLVKDFGMYETIVVEFYVIISMVIQRRHKLFHTSCTRFIFCQLYGEYRAGKGQTAHDGGETHDECLRDRRIRQL